MSFTSCAVRFTIAARRAAPRSGPLNSAAVGPVSSLFDSCAYSCSARSALLPPGASVCGACPRFTALSDCAYCGEIWSAGCTWSANPNIRFPNVQRAEYLWSFDAGLCHCDTSRAVWSMNEPRVLYFCSAGGVVTAMRASLKSCSSSASHSSPMYAAIGAFSLRVQSPPVASELSGMFAAHQRDMRPSRAGSMAFCVDAMRL